MDRQRLTHFLDACGREIYSFCCYLAGNRQDADDLYQDTCLFALERTGIPDDFGDAKRVLLAVASKLWRGRKRKFAIRRRIMRDVIQPTEEFAARESGQQSDPAEILMNRAAREAVREQVMRLPDKQKIVVLLYYMEEFSEAEIAQILEIPTGTVKSRLHTARKALERSLR